MNLSLHSICPYYVFMDDSQDQNKHPRSENKGKKVVELDGEPLKLIPSKSLIFKNVFELAGSSKT